MKHRPCRAAENELSKARVTEGTHHKSFRSAHLKIALKRHASVRVLAGNIDGLCRVGIILRENISPIDDPFDQHVPDSASAVTAAF